MDIRKMTWKRDANDRLFDNLSAFRPCLQFKFKNRQSESIIEPFEVTDTKNPALSWVLDCSIVDVRAINNESKKPKLQPSSSYS